MTTAATSGRICCIEISLTIPDNEARTAQATLARLGVDVARLRRADVYCFELDDDADLDVAAAAHELETIYNRSKHVLRARAATPRSGEAWIDDGCVTEASGGVLRISGRALAGLRRVTRYVSWSLADASGAPADAALLDRALETLLCNSAFQKAIR